MKAIIPIAGKGTRTYPLSFATPKPLLRIKGKPTLYYVTKILKKFNIEKVVYVISPNLIESIDEIKKINNLKCDFVIQKKPLGLGDAILCAEEKVKKGKCLIVLGDSILDVDIKNFNKNKNYIGVFHHQDPRRFGIVVLDNNKIAQVEEKPEKPKTNLVICGIYYLRKIEILFSALREIEKRNLKTKGEFQLTDAFKILLEKGEELYTLKVKKWLDTGTLDEILETHKKILNKKEILEKKNIKNTKIIPPVWIDKNVNIENSEIGPFVSIETECKIKNSKIENVLVYKGTKILNSIIKKGIIGDYSVIENLKSEEIFITNKSKIIS
ncbi:MAG: sugar phosphate nucleotidyltransferase [candidate division WOR-3 bacterium]